MADAQLKNTRGASGAEGERVHTSPAGGLSNGPNTQRERPTPDADAPTFFGSNAGDSVVARSRFVPSDYGTGCDEFPQ